MRASQPRCAPRPAAAQALLACTSLHGYLICFSASTRCEALSLALKTTPYLQCHGAGLLMHSGKQTGCKL